MNKILNKCYIYILTSPSTKNYVGQTININKRFESYRNLHRTTQIKLSSAILKYGWENFTIKIIEYSNITQKELDDLEIQYIKKLNSYKEGYNCTIGGGGKRVHYTEEEKKQAKRETNRKYRENHKEKIKLSNKKYNESEIGKFNKREYYLKHYSENKEIITERNKRYIINNKEFYLERRRRYYQKNKERENKRCRDLYWKKKLNINNDK
jgi:group I intron endonuclease